MAGKGKEVGSRERVIRQVNSQIRKEEWSKDPLEVIPIHKGDRMVTR